MNPAVSRTRLLQLAAGRRRGTARSPAGRTRTAARAVARAALVRNRGRRYFGDRQLFASVSPGVAGRDTASVAFSLDRPATVQLEAVRTALRKRTTVWQTEQFFDVGYHRLWWRPSEEMPVGSYVMRLTVEDESGNRKTYGGTRPATASRSRTPVVRILGVEAAFEKRSYAPLEPAQLTITADAERITLQFLACGTEKEYTDRTDEMRGEWSARPSRTPGRGSGRRRRRSRSTSAIGPAASTPPS